MIKGSKVILRAMEPADINLTYEWENDPDNWLVSQSLIPFSRKTLAEWVSKEHDLAKDSQYRFMICTADGKLAGTLDLFEFNPLHSRCGIGLLIGDKDLRRKGLASEALQLAIEYGWDHLNLNQWWCTILEGNEASISLFESLGFKRAGVRKSWISHKGKWIDLYDYQLLRNE